MKATWYNQINGQTESNLITLNIPQGFYNSTQLIQYLCYYLPAVDDNGYLLSFGNTSLNSDGTYIYPAFDLDQFSYKFYVSQYAQLLTQSQSGTNAIIGPNPHIYKTFEWVIDEETLGFNQLIGYVMNAVLPGQNSNNSIQSNNAQLHTFLEGQNKISIQCAYTVDGLGNYTYTLFTASGSPTLDIPFPDLTIGQLGYPSRFIADLQPQKSLYIHLKNYTTTVRAPNLTLSQSDVLAVVPIDVQYGEQINLVVQNLLPAFNHSFNASTIEIQITDERGREVDFQGCNWDMSLVITFAANELHVPIQDTARPDNHVANSTFMASNAPSGTSMGNGQLSKRARL